MSENGTETDTPVGDTLLVMTAASVENSDLSPREFMSPGSPRWSP